MPHILSALESMAVEVLLDIPTEERLLSVTLATLPRPGDHVRIAFVIKAGSGAARGAVKREFRVERVTFSGTLKPRGDEWRGAPFATILEVAEVRVNKAFLPPDAADGMPSSAPLATRSDTRLVAETDQPAEPEGE